jgi:hypothetical protein
MGTKEKAGGALWLETADLQLLGLCPGDQGQLNLGKAKGRKTPHEPPARR